MRRRRWLIGIGAFAVLAAGVGYAAWPAARPAPAVVEEEPDDPFMPLKQRIETDLKLVAHRGSPHGGAPRVSVALVNTSRHRTYRIPDTSQSGRANIVWTATVDLGDGKPKPHTDRQTGRCCLTPFDFIPGRRKPNDQKWVEFHPGTSIVYEMGREFIFRQPGHVRLTASYHQISCRPRNVSPPQWAIFPPEAVTAEVDTPAFELTSNTLEFDVLR